MLDEQPPSDEARHDCGVDTLRHALRQDTPARPGLSPWDFEEAHQEAPAERRGVELAARYRWALDAVTAIVGRGAGKLDIGPDYCALIVTIGQRREFRMGLLDESVTPSVDKAEDPERATRLEAALGRLVIGVFRGETAA